MEDRALQRKPLFVERIREFNSLVFICKLLGLRAAQPF
jgi:hypothetical protein